MIGIKIIVKFLNEGNINFDINIDFFLDVFYFEK